MLETLPGLPQLREGGLPRTHTAQGTTRAKASRAPPPTPLALEVTLLPRLLAATMVGAYKRPGCWQEGVQVVWADSWGSNGARAGPGPAACEQGVSPSLFLQGLAAPRGAPGV